MEIGPNFAESVPPSVFALLDPSIDLPDTRTVIWDNDNPAKVYSMLNVLSACVFNLDGDTLGFINPALHQVLHVQAIDTIALGTATAFLFDDAKNFSIVWYSEDTDTVYARVAMHDSQPYMDYNGIAWRTSTCGFAPEFRDHVWAHKCLHAFDLTVRSYLLMFETFKTRAARELQFEVRHVHTGLDCVDTILQDLKRVTNVAEHIAGQVMVRKFAFDYGKYGMDDTEWQAKVSALAPGKCLGTVFESWTLDLDPAQFLVVECFVQQVGVSYDHAHLLSWGYSEDLPVWNKLHVQFWSQAIRDTLRALDPSDVWKVADARKGETALNLYVYVVVRKHVSTLMAQWMRWRTRKHWCAAVVSAV
jgi:hypothetical protein